MHTRTETIEDRIQSLGVQLDAIETALAVAINEPPGPHRDEWLATVGATAAIAREEQIALTVHASKAQRPRLVLIKGGLASVTAVIGAGTAAASHRIRSHPVAAATTVGAVAVAATAGVVLYLGSGSGPAPTAAPPVASAPGGPGRRSSATPPAQWSPWSPKPIPSAAVPGQPPIPGETFRRWPGTWGSSPASAPTPGAGASPSPTYSGPPVVPPVSPSPRGQHPTCLRLRLMPSYGLRVCAER